MLGGIVKFIHFIKPVFGEYENMTKISMFLNDGNKIKFILTRKVTPG
jgi:hypothetical protein